MIDTGFFFEHADWLVKEARRAGAEEGEVYFSVVLERAIKYQDRKAERSSFSRNSGFALRVSLDGLLGFAYVTSDDKDMGKQMIEEALTSARFGDEPSVGFRHPPPSLPMVGKMEDEGFGRRPRTAAVELIEGQIEKAFRFSDRVDRIKNATFSEKLFKEGLVSSNGFRGEKGGTLYTISAMVMASRESEKEVAYEWNYSRFFDDIASSRTIVEAAERAVALLGGSPVKTGGYPIVLDPQVACSFLSVLADSLSGEMVARGKSPMAGRLESEVVSPRITLINDGLKSGGYASAPFDDEGVPQQKMEIISRGVLKEYLMNLKASHLLHRTPTGSGYRTSFKSMPSIRGSNLHVERGASSREDLFSRMDRGLYVLEILGGHTMDPISGNVSLGAAGFTVENGMLGRPFRGVTIAGNLYEMFRQVVGVADDLRFYAEVGSPSLLIENVDVAGRQ